MSIQNEYAVYLDLCKASNVEPLPMSGQFAIIQEIWALGPHVIPYLTSTGHIWVHNTQHKTHRADRPFEVANMTALKKQP